MKGGNECGRPLFEEKGQWVLETLICGKGGMNINESRLKYILTAVP